MKRTIIAAIIMLATAAPMPAMAQGRDVSSGSRYRRTSGQVSTQADTGRIRQRSGGHSDLRTIATPTPRTDAPAQPRAIVTPQPTMQRRTVAGRR